ncbi:N-acetylglucosamine-6-phosphate deacetylase [Microbacterium lushaniae]|uniref:N-acetylglucosamine-6-phosphate deacetylase n=1 Tax=Microbacterium lushaniae TaxID=2614639 RepID=A0A5J6L1K6_9MICO|nr:N-acetylglucosamine-6-phosphate deacetylase [Microbacterium lushaniae]QEW02357.1 N-acetylglucosamine-6-phosphate deacetylase [Microbacterium lushaniae]
MSTIVHSAALLDGGTRTDAAWVRFAGGRVAERGTGRSWQDAAADTVVDAAELAGPGAILSPGFVDIHGHGGGGFAFDDGPDAIRAARTLHRRHGTTSAVVSLVTAPLDDLVRRTRMIAELARTDADILGSHLEGPFLDPAHRGAHDPAALASPVAVEALLTAGAGTVRQVTIAPELPGAFEAIRDLTAAGAVAAIGHTGADAALTAAAFDAGARILTHVFNAMPGLHHRAPGPAGAALTDDRVTIELIADGVHVHPELVRIAFAAAPGRIALVSDAMAATGVGDGRYTLGGLTVDVTGGVARLADGGAIAGSTLTQDHAVRVAVAAGVPLPEALRAVTATPARAIGAGDEVGHLRPGGRADAVLLDAGLNVRAVWAGGAPVR